MEKSCYAILHKTICMAEINTSSVHNRHARTSCKKRSTTVDLAPLVDLGFIFLTFFVFTAALSQPMAMKLAVPNDKERGITDELCESCVLTLLLGSDNKAWYYEGNAPYSKEQLTNYSANGIRKLIQAKKRKVEQLRGSDQFVLVIKPSAQSNFKNLIDVVDECSINMVKRYYIDELKTGDREWLSAVPVGTKPLPAPSN
jgi:biopolymer transport protein ExbD